VTVTKLTSSGISTKWFKDQGARVLCVEGYFRPNADDFSHPFFHVSGCCAGQARMTLSRTHCFPKRSKSSNKDVFSIYNLNIPTMNFSNRKNPNNSNMNPNIAPAPRDHPHLVKI
jgi:hypothetical protein